MTSIQQREDIAGQELASALKRLLALQQPRGCWEGEVVWCPIITAQYVIVRAVVGRPLHESERAGIIRQFEVTRVGAGGWGLHRESLPYVFVTTLVYVALRLLGLSSEHPLASAARRWLRCQPQGVLGIPTWGKFWLALLGLYRWEGVNPCPPELFLLPRWLPIHPSHFYCHTRLIYQAMAFLYGVRLEAEFGPLRDELRSELYDRTWPEIDFASHRHDVAQSDVFVRTSRVLRGVYDLWTLGESGGTAPNNVVGLRQYALDRCFEHILIEQRTTQYQGISPVSGLLNCLAIWARDRNHPDLAPSLEGLEAWRWQDEASGIRYAGARSNAWDTAIAVQAILDLPNAATLARQELRQAYRFLRDAQIKEEVSNYRDSYRDPALGGWCFSDGRHQWPVSDCTAEALTAVLGLHEVEGLIPLAERISDARLCQALDFILLRQNRDGGFSTYERRRSGRWVEAINPSEMFGNCMLDHSYVECTASCLRALARFRNSSDTSRKVRIDRAIQCGCRFLRSQQGVDGAFVGSWGINFTYGTMFALAGLRAAGVSPDDPAVARAADWLILHQRKDGGWGEHFSSCTTNEYVEHSESQVAMTSWALLGLLEASKASSDAAARGAAWLCSHLRPDGSWPEQSVNGVFFGTAMLDYQLYNTYFPLWALAHFSRVLGNAAPVEAMIE